LNPPVGSSSGPPGACITPSIETMAPTIVFLITRSVLPDGVARDALAPVSVLGRRAEPLPGACHRLRKEPAGSRAIVRVVGPGCYGEGRLVAKPAGCGVQVDERPARGRGEPSRERRGDPLEH